MRSFRSWVAAREAVLAFALTIALELEYLHRLSPAEAVLALLITVPLVARLVLPLVVLGVVLTGIVVQSWLGGVAGTDFPVVPVVALVVALYAVGSRTSWPRTFVAGALTVVAWVVATQLTVPRGSVLLGVLVTA